MPNVHWDGRKRHAVRKNNDDAADLLFVFPLLSLTQLH
jgi:hypothetical protein